MPPISIVLYGGAEAIGTLASMPATHTATTSTLADPLSTMSIVEVTVGAGTEDAVGITDADLKVPAHVTEDNSVCATDFSAETTATGLTTTPTARLATGYAAATTNLAANSLATELQ